MDDVATYSGWSKVDSGLSVSGIFFDETPHDFSRRKQQFLITANEAVKNATGLREPKLVRCHLQPPRSETLNILTILCHRSSTTLAPYLMLA